MRELLSQKPHQDIVETKDDSTVDYDHHKESKTDEKYATQDENYYNKLPFEIVKPWKSIIEITNDNQKIDIKLVTNAEKSDHIEYSLIYITDPTERLTKNLMLPVPPRKTKLYVDILDDKLLLKTNDKSTRGGKFILYATNHTNGSETEKTITVKVNSSDEENLAILDNQNNSK
jgi:hypothetical protein